MLLESHGARTSHGPAAPAPPPPPAAAGAAWEPPVRSAFRHRSPSSASSPEAAAVGAAAARHCPQRLQEGAGGWSWAGRTPDQQGAPRGVAGGPVRSWGRNPKAATRRKPVTETPYAWPRRGAAPAVAGAAPAARVRAVRRDETAAATTSRRKGTATADERRRLRGGGAEGFREVWWWWGVGWRRRRR
jgi:hypothetical protein